MGKAKNNLMFILFLMIGIVVGSLLGNVLGQVESLAWLRYGIDFGMPDPWQLNLGVMTLTFGFTVNFTIASIIGVAIALFVFKKIA